MASVKLHATDLFPKWGNTFWHDSVPESMRQSYIAFGEQYLGQQWYSLPASVFAEFKKTGNRTHYESILFEKRRQLAALVMAEIMFYQRHHQRTTEYSRGNLVGITCPL